MRYAILSDIHANLHAWNAVKADIEAQGVEAIICLGDVIGYGPRPRETLDDVAANSSYILLGNHEAVIEGSFNRSQFNDEACVMIEWTDRQLGEDDRDFFKQLPFVLEMEAETCKVLFVHGSAMQPETFGYVLDEQDAQSSWDACDAALVFAGHTHETAVFMNDGGKVTKLETADFNFEPGKKYFVNVGSVGMPREADVRASYCIFDSIFGSVFFRKISYDFDAFEEDVLQIIGDNAQSKHVLSSFKEAHLRPIAEQLDFTPPTESQMISMPSVHRERLQIKASVAPPKQFRLKKAGIHSRKSPLAQSAAEAKMRKWFFISISLLFFLFVAAVVAMVLFFKPPRRPAERAEVKLPPAEIPLKNAPDANRPKEAAPAAENKAAQKAEPPKVEPVKIDPAGPQELSEWCTVIRPVKAKYGEKVEIKVTLSNVIPPAKLGCNLDYQKENGEQGAWLSAEPVDVLGDGIFTFTFQLAGRDDAVKAVPVIFLSLDGNIQNTTASCKGAEFSVSK